MYKTPKKIIFSLTLSKMAKTLNKGEKFEDFSSLEIAIQQYQKEGNVQFFRRQKLTLKVIENRILHTARPSARSSVSTILLFVFVLRSNIST